MTTSPHDNPSRQTNEIARILTGLHQRWHTTSGGAQVATLAQAGVHHVPGARWASVVLHRPGRIHTLVATDPIAAETEALQQELGSGPGVDPVLEGNIYHCGNLAGNRRWPEFGTQVRDRLGLASLVTCRVALPEDAETTIGFTVYSNTPDAFHTHALWATTLFASQAALAASAQLHRQQLQNLERAVESNREIGAAVGVLMARHGITRHQAFALLRETSQSTSRKVAAIATDVVDTGELVLPPTLSSRQVQRTPKTSP